LILTIDSFAWIEVIRGSFAGNRARALIVGSEACFTPAVVLGEVALACVTDGMSDPVIAQELEAIHETSEVVPIDDTIAVAGAYATNELRQRARSAGLPTPGLADGLILATARGLGSRLLTGDRHFRDFRETLWLT
jgi:predicted nucleic acid-binding protein